MRERVNLIVGDGADRVWVSTFHSLCVRILRRYADRLGYGKSFDIYDADDQKSLVKSILKDLQIDPKRYPEKMFMSEISKAKEKYMSCDEFARKMLQILLQPRSLMYIRSIRTASEKQCHGF